MPKRLATALAAIALLAAPAAAARTAPAPAASALGISGAVNEGNDVSGGLSAGVIIGAIFVVAVIGLLVFGGEDESDRPVSP